MTGYDAIVFDLDGTLWDATEACADGWNRALRAQGVDDVLITPEDMKTVSGMPFVECVQMLLPERSPETDGALFEAIDASERVRLEAAGGAVFDGVVEGLRSLGERLPLFLVSNCQDWYLAAFWRHFPVRSCFTDSDCHGRSGSGKTAMIRALVAAHGLRRPIYVGDTEGDERACAEAGVEFGYAAYGFGSARAPHRTFRTFGAVVEHFCGRYEAR